jgi:hypothetical protein
MTRFLALAAAITLLSPSSPAEAAPCAITGLSPKVLSRPGVTIPSDGGIVVAAESGPGGKLAGGEVAEQKGWRFRVRSGRIAPTSIDIIAPGLAVYRLPARADAAVLEDDAHAVVARAQLSKDARPRLPAPKIKQVLYAVSRGGRRTSTMVTAELDGTAPSDAVALVIADASGKPRSWAHAQGGSSLWLYAGGGCSMKPAGTEISNPGDKVILFWVDAAGRTSAPTKALTVADGSTITP